MVFFDKILCILIDNSGNWVNVNELFFNIRIIVVVVRRVNFLLLRNGIRGNFWMKCI